jgi:hypothetical protein
MYETAWLTGIEKNTAASKRICNVFENRFITHLLSVSGKILLDFENHAVFFMRFCFFAD